jgi:hypothetical protein
MLILITTDGLRAQATEKIVIFKILAINLLVYYTIIDIGEV